jgi:hypothetical protein
MGSDKRNVGSPFSKNEKKKKYFKYIVLELINYHGHTKDEAQLIAEGMIRYLEAKVHNGDNINLGFMSIRKFLKKSQQICDNLRPEKNQVYLIPERIAWKVNIFRSWQLNYKPSWSILRRKK